MDTIANVGSLLRSWDAGGEQKCRDMLTSALSSATDMANSEVIMAALHTLAISLFTTDTLAKPMNPTSLTTFLRSVQQGCLPSSSAQTNVSYFEQVLIDMIWAVEFSMEEAAASLKADDTKQASGPSRAETDKVVLVQFAQQLLTVGLITARLCRERFDPRLSASLDLLDQVAFERKEVRTKTHLLYRQNKFNLLREQSEGYSKLNSELTSNLGPAHSPNTGAPLEPATTIAQRAETVWRKVIGLIGYFDLDPNRVLDIILDVFSVHLGTHYSFFVALLSFSPWTGAYVRNSTEAAGLPQQPSFHGRSLDEILADLEPERQGVNGSGENAQVLAQVLGFKFAYYQSKDVSEVTPKQLYLTAAILIREGFITLEELLPHLDPFDEDMEEVHKQYKASIKTRISGTRTNVLAMAGALESSTPSSSSKPQGSADQPKPDAKPKTSQRAGLLSALLAVGSLRPALAMISRHRWLVEAYPENADLIIRIIKHGITPLYETTVITKEKRPTFAQPRARYGSGGVVAPPPRKPLLNFWAPTPPSSSTHDFVFFFPRWVERIPVCSRFEDLMYVIEPLMNFVGPLVSRDPVFLTKFIRLARLHLQSTVPLDESGKRKMEVDESDPVCQFWYTMIRKYLLPALCLISGNAVFGVEVWSIVRLYSTTSRYRLYGEWRACYTTHGELQVKEAQCNTESRAILRRLSHQTIESLSGAVAKLAHSNPIIFFTIAISQISSYENLAEVVILAMKYLTSMDFEALVFVLLDALSNEDKERVKSDGVNISDWLQNLASFTGMLFRRYPTDLTPILQYLVHQLHARQTSEITLLREIILKMAGIEPLPDLSDQQIIAMAGGPALRIEAVASKTRGARLEGEHIILKAPQRLGKCLLDSNLALPLLIEVAQQRQACVFLTNSEHLKSLSGLYDATHGVLCQYLELLTTPGIVSPKEYSARVLPSLGDLGGKYGICAPMCMQIIRPVLHASLLSTTLSMSTEETEKRLKAEMIARRKAASASSRVASPAAPAPAASGEDASTEQKSTEENGVVDDSAMAVDSTVPTVPPSPWLPELAALFDDVRKIVPPHVIDIIGVGFYTTFWQLSTYDLSPPLSKYEEEMASLKSSSRSEDQALSRAEKSSDRITRQQSSTYRQRRDRYNDFAQTLSQEVKDQSLMRAATIRRMSREKQHWFEHLPKATFFALLFIEHCLQPRSLLSPMDADFCAQIIKVLQVLGTPGFPSLTIYDRLLSDHIKVVVFSCSEYEARNYGRFLRGILSDLYRWFQDEQVYLQDNRTKTGGKTVLHPGFQVRFLHNLEITTELLLKWADLKRALKKWHVKLAKCLTECIQNKEFMHVYNAILVLKEVLPVFPLSEVSDCGRMLHDAVEQRIETEQRGDLKIICTTYLSGLRARQNLWSKARSHPPANPPSNAPSPAPRGSAPLPSTSAPATNGRSAAVPIVAPTPSAPRSQLVPPRPTTAKLAMDSIPRPEVVKRIRADARNGASPQPGSDSRPHTPSVPDIGLSGGASTPSLPQLDAVRVATGTNTPRLSSPLSVSERKDHQAPASGLSVHGSQEYPSPAADTAANMPPPSNPSLTSEAQELRETAKQTIGKDRYDDRGARPPADTRGQPSTNALPASQDRSSSPASRPGTRNASVESRHSTDRPRSDRGSREDSRRGERSEREGRQSSRDRERAPSRRDSLTHSGSRSNRHREGDREERERDRGRDRHGDRDRDKDREHRDRDRDRERREKGDRHPRDGEERERDGRKEREREPRSDRENAGRNPSTPSGPPAVDDRGLPSRPDPKRHPDETLKRRRGYEEEDRGTKRGPRKDGHRESRDDRPRRASEKDASDRPRERDSDRRHGRRDRDDGDGESSPAERTPLAERRAPEAPSAKNLPASTPSGPRAMAETRGGRGDPRDRDGRDTRDRGPSGANGHSGAHEGGGSLRSRMSDNRPAQNNSPTTTPNREHRFSEERDPKKRTISERDSEGQDPPPGGGDSADSQPQKRLKIRRDRYPTGGAPSSKRPPNQPQGSSDRGAPRRRSREV